MSSAPILTGLRLGVFVVQAPLGSGGMGVVFRALDTNLNRPVAIKFLSDELANPIARRRFHTMGAGIYRMICPNRAGGCNMVAVTAASKK